MLIKSPKPSSFKWLKRGAIFFFAGETLLFGVSYAAWYGVNTRRDYRKYLHDNYPTLLEGYYKLGETFDSGNRIREIDYAYWQAESR